MNACNCIGPQNGDPRCPCMMARRKDDQRYFYEPKDDKGYLVFKDIPSDRAIKNPLTKQAKGFSITTSTQRQ